jgi:hypothetical protein
MKSVESVSESVSPSSRIKWTTSKLTILLDSLVDVVKRCGGIHPAPRTKPDSEMYDRSWPYIGALIQPDSPVPTSKMLSKLQDLPDYFYVRDFNLYL